MPAISRRTTLTDSDLHDLQRKTFRYFWSETNPENGLLADNTLGNAPASIAGVGMALASYPDGSGLQQLTHGSDGEALYPVWSPDGKHLAFYDEGSEGKNSFIMEIGKHWKEQTPQALPASSNAIGSFAVRSWSPDGKKLAGFYLRADGFFSGITVYSFESQKFQQLVDFGIDTIGSDSVWLKDSRRMLFNHQGKIYLADTQSKKIREVLSVTPHEVNRGLTVSRDDRLICYTVAVTEADIWLLSLE